MITCPVCEAPREAGAECPVCGLAPLAPPPPDAPVPRMEELETTALEEVEARPALEPFPELEPTVQAGIGPVEVEPFPELEPTRAMLVEAPIEPVPDLEITAAAPAEPRSPQPAFPICRYCRTPSGPGDWLCSRCGMWLGAPQGAPIAGDTPPIRLCSCGTPVSRSICPTCGARNGTA